MAAVSSDPNFVTFQPGAIDYAEQRIYRELNPIANQVRDSSASLTSSSRTFALPTSVGTFVSVQAVNVITPSSQTLTTGGSRVKLAPSSLNMLDFLYPTEISSGVPSLFAIVDNATIAVGPTPNSSYQIEVIGTIRPAPLSASNSSTYLTQNLPDLFFAATAIFAAGYMRDFGMQADNPQMSQSWENQYKLLFQTAAQEEIRKKFNTTFPSVFTAPPTSGGPV
jgi:hypothetical protein